MKVRYLQGPVTAMYGAVTSFILKQKELYHGILQMNQTSF
jgi:hypothetical protein